MLVPFTKNGKRLQGALERLRGVALVEGKGDEEPERRRRGS